MFFGALWLVQIFGEVQDPLCLIVFPPERAAGIAAWVIQVTFSGTIVWWLWVRGGARVLARLAPAFTTGPVLEHRFSPQRVRLLVSAVVVLAPLGNILMQLSGIGAQMSCQSP